MKVLFVPAFHQDAVDPSKICENGVDIPPCYSISVKRKFIIVGKPGTPNGLVTEDTLTLVIGPVFGNYFHKSLFHSRAVPDGMEVSGGGYVTFTGSKVDGKMMWAAKFHDESGDYGVFDYRILSKANSQKIADALQIGVQFELSDYASPKMVT